MVNDDWRTEIQQGLKQSELYLTLEKKLQHTPFGPSAIALVNDGVYYAYQRTKTIIRHMGQFTLHDADHLFRVLHLMERLLGVQNIKDLSPPELMLLILSSFFHDVGMAPDEIEVLAWKKVWDNSPEFANKEEEEGYNKFKRFCSARPEKQDEINFLLGVGKVSQAEINMAYLITEYIRQTHAERVRELIGRDWNNKILYKDVDLTVEFAQVCYSHNEDALTLLDLDKNYLCGPNTVACLPLVGLLLRLADILDFDAKRTPAILFSHLNVRHPVSIKEWNKHRSVESWEINPQLIQFSAKCTHPAIEEAIREFCDLIDKELTVCNNILSILNPFNKQEGRELNIKIPFKVDRSKIETKKDVYNKPLYLYHPTKFNLSKRQVIDLLMGTKLYGDPVVALRELIQNSIDACLLRQAQERKWSNPYHPEITVKYYSEEGDNILEVIDNGTGMDQYIIDNYYSKVGSSFYKSVDFFNLKSESNADFTPTSRFGIGILSCFMVADTLIVNTKRVLGAHKSSDPLSIRVEGQESIFWIQDGQRETPGTTTKLILRKKENPWEEMSEEEFVTSVEKIIPNPPFKINIITSSIEKSKDEKSFDAIKASSLKDLTWHLSENIRVFEIDFDKKELGIMGSALVAVLESKKNPVESIELTSLEIEVQEESYTLEKSLSISENLIKQHSNSITVNDDGEISKDTSYSEYARSRSRISLHGIEIPTSLFPHSWEVRNNQVRISWPFPLTLVVDVCGNRDLDLNSSRTQIINTEKWIDFEEQLAYIICQEIASSVSKKYWTALRKIFLKKAKNTVFLDGLKRVIR